MYVLFSPFGRIAPRGASARVDKERTFLGADVAMQNTICFDYFACFIIQVGPTSDMFGQLN